ncbi:low temperature requirement protein A [Microbacterium luticocti]|uniref:low temperature requirement protein A n=1 Tax=Microbacterium luticocti TaxID=451764 RepID=UPI00041DA82F|nr:low temperature requirement protein A [Microbacterium luticocti]
MIRTGLGLRRMMPRDRTEPFRAASPLELLFDLVFVVAVSQAAGSLHELVSAGRVGQGVLAYLMVFFAIWWAWMNFTWFASAFDTDDWAYRLMTFLQMGGVLVLAAGVQDAVASYDFAVVTWGYVIMRLAMVGQWLRAAASHPGSRRTAVTFAVGIAAVQVLWVARLYLLDVTWQFATFFVLVVAEIAVPVIAERQGRTAWHPHHIADRYGCFTLIVLGESVLASATAVFAARGQGAHALALVGLAAAGLAIAAGMWWVYFVHGQGDRLAETGRGFGFGYAHYLIFAAAGAVSAGIGASVDVATGRTALSAAAAALVLTVPVGGFVVAVWLIMLRPLISRTASVLVLVSAAVIVASAAVPQGAVAATAVLLAVVVVVLEVDRGRQAG